MEAQPALQGASPCCHELAAEAKAVQVLREVQAPGAQLDAAAHDDARRWGRQRVRLAAQRCLLLLGQGM